MMSQEALSDHDVLLEQINAIARFGDHALHTDDLQALLDEAVALAAKGLDVDRAKVLELTEDGEALFVRAGIGWDPGVVGAARIGVGRESGAGYALLTGEPVISEDLDSETRFETPELLRRHRIESAVNVIIKGANHRPFGVLEIDSEKRRRFTQASVDFLQGFANLLAAAVYRLQMNQKLKAAAEEKMLLLRELQHRVKNNLQTVTSIVRIQKTLLQNEEAQRSFETLTNRLTALSLVHKQLHTREETRALALNGYLEELCSNLITAANLGCDDIKLDLRLEPIVVPVDLGSSIGLITNEFITNSMQHAFPDRRGAISVMLERVGRDRAQLTLADNGVGRQPQGEAGTRSGLGQQLIQSLVEQIGGTIEWSEGPGTQATILFPL